MPDFRVQTPRVAFGLSLLILCMTCVSAFAPQWHIVYPPVRTMGLSESCYRGTCATNDYAGLCHSASQYKSRMTATEAFTWIGIATTILIICVSGVKAIIFTKEAMSTRYTYSLCGLAAWAVISYVIAIAIFGATVSKFWRCGASFCSQFSDYCTIGVSYGLLIAALGLLVLAVVPLTVFVAVKTPNGDEVPSWSPLVTCAVALVSAGLAVGAAKTHVWMMILEPTRHFGLWHDCIGDTCTTKQYAFLSGVCGRSETVIASRFKVSGAFMILTFIMALLAAVYFSTIQMRILSLPKTGPRRGLLALYVLVMILFQVIAVAVYGDTVNNYSTCGSASFCTLQAQLGNSCTYGTSFGTAMVSFILMAALLALLALDARGCCITKVASSRSSSPEREGESNEPHNLDDAPSAAAKDDGSTSRDESSRRESSPAAAVPSGRASAAATARQRTPWVANAPDSAGSGWDQLSAAHVDSNYRI